MPICKRLDKLQPVFRDKVEQFLAECRRKDLNVSISETWRDMERQRQLVSEGKSWTYKSNHLTGNAIDVFHNEKGREYNMPMSWWNEVYDIAEKYGMKPLYRTYGVDKPHIDNNFEIKFNYKPMNNKISEWATIHAEWCKQHGIIENWEDPQKTITKEELAKTLHVLAKKILDWTKN